MAAEATRAQLIKSGASHARDASPVNLGKKGQADGKFPNPYLKLNANLPNENTNSQWDILGATTHKQNWARLRLNFNEIFKFPGHNLGMNMGLITLNTSLIAEIKTQTKSGGRSKSAIDPPYMHVLGAHFKHAKGT